MEGLGLGDLRREKNQEPRRRHGGALANCLRPARARQRPAFSGPTASAQRDEANGERKVAGDLQLQGCPTTGVADALRFWYQTADTFKIG